jgi:hypothetical protein
MLESISLISLTTTYQTAISTTIIMASASRILQTTLFIITTSSTIPSKHMMNDPIIGIMAIHLVGNYWSDSATKGIGRMKNLRER